MKTESSYVQRASKVSECWCPEYAQRLSKMCSVVIQSGIKQMGIMRVLPENPITPLLNGTPKSRSGCGSLSSKVRDCENFRTSAQTLSNASEMLEREKVCQFCQNWQRKALTPNPCTGVSKMSSAGVHNVHNVHNVRPVQNGDGAHGAYGSYKSFWTHPLLILDRASPYFGQRLHSTVSVIWED